MGEGGEGGVIYHDAGSGSLLAAIFLRRGEPGIGSTVVTIEIYEMGEGKRGVWICLHIPGYTL